MGQAKGRYLLGFCLLTLLLLTLLILNLNAGSVPITPKQIWGILCAQGGETPSERIIWNIRLPRLLCAALLGAGLSVSGFLLQVFFSNPIAGPFVLGISSSAKLAVALTLILCLKQGVVLGSAALILAAFVGSGLALVTILLISSRVKQMSMLVVCGVMIGYICSAITDFVVTFADDSNIANLHHWSMGSFSGMDWSNVRTVTSLILLGLIAAFLLSKPISAYLMGEVYAQNMGVNIRFLRIQLILLSSLLSACVTAFAGPISFVGVAVPHLMKRLFCTSKPILIIPACALGGANFCLFCDLLARVLFAPTELSISSVTAVFGAPVVIWMMLSRHRGRVHL